MRSREIRTEPLAGTYVAVIRDGMYRSWIRTIDASDTDQATTRARKYAARVGGQVHSVREAQVRV